MQKTPAAKTQPDHKNGHKPEPVVLPEQTSDFVGVAELPGGLVGANGDDLHSQAGRLGDTRLQTVQRQRAAMQIGQLQGNYHLQRVIQTAISNRKNHRNGRKAKTRSGAKILRPGSDSITLPVDAEFLNHQSHIGIQKSHLKETQRSDFASHIGKTQGNQHLAIMITAIHGKDGNVVQRNSPNGTATVTDTPSGPVVTVPGIFMPVEIRRYDQLLGAGRFYASMLRDRLREVDQTAYVYETGQQWLKEFQEVQPWLQEQGNQSLSQLAAAQAERWFDDLIEIFEDIAAYKRGKIRDGLRRAQEALEAAAVELEKKQPELDEAMRQAFLSGDDDVIGKVAGIVGTITSIGMDLRSLSRDIVSEINLLFNKNYSIPDASRYTNWLDKINKSLAAFNLIYSLVNLNAPTQYGKALNGLNALTGAFSSASTLFNLAPHIGLYANLYLVPLTQAIVAQLNVIIGKYVHNWNMVAAEIGKDIGIELDMANEPGGWPMFRLILPVMHAQSPAEVPWPIPEEAEEYLLDWRDEFESGTQAEMPTTGWWFWRDLDDPKIKPWLFNNRRRIWAMLYGSMKVPELSVLNKKP